MSTSQDPAPIAKISKPRGPYAKRSNAPGIYELQDFSHFSEAEHPGYHYTRAYTTSRYMCWFLSYPRTDTSMATLEAIAANPGFSADFKYFLVTDDAKELFNGVNFHLIYCEAATKDHSRGSLLKMLGMKPTEIIARPRNCIKYDRERCIAFVCGRAPFGDGFRPPMRHRAFECKTGRIHHLQVLEKLLASLTLGEVDEMIEFGHVLKSRRPADDTESPTGSSSD